MTYLFSIIENNNNNSINILNFLNNLHPNIKFTTEEEKDGSLPFLDVRINATKEGYKTTMYRKKTFTGVYLNWTSLTSKKYKLSLIYTLMDRIWKICSDNKARDIEVRRLKEILIKNEYPEEIVAKEIDKFIKNRNEKEQQQQLEQNNEQQQQLPNKPEKRFLVLPFANNKAEQYAKKLRHLVKTNYPQIDFKVAFKAPNEIGKLFPFKDKTTKMMKSLVVYKLKCSTCGGEYIGKTKRILALRAEEHMHKDKDSAVYHHKKRFPSHKIDYEGIEIIDSANSNLKLEVKEQLHIKKLKPSLNTQHTSKSKSLKTLIIA